MCTNGRNFYNSSTVVGKRVYENLNSNLLEMRLLLTALCVNVIDDGVPVCKLDVPVESGVFGVRSLSRSRSVFGYECTTRIRHSPLAAFLVW
jgi:hypothetical protein